MTNSKNITTISHLTAALAASFILISATNANAGLLSKIEHGVTKVTSTVKKVTETGINKIVKGAEKAKAQEEHLRKTIMSGVKAAAAAEKEAFVVAAKASLKKIKEGEKGLVHAAKATGRGIEKGAKAAEHVADEGITAVHDANKAVAGVSGRIIKAVAERAAHGATLIPGYPFGGSPEWNDR